MTAGSGPQDGRNWSQGTLRLCLWPLRWGLVFPSEGPRGAASSCVESGLHLAWYITLGWAEQPSRNNLVLSPNAVAQAWTLFTFFWLYIFVLNRMENEWSVFTRNMQNNNYISQDGLFWPYHPHYLSNKWMHI